MRTFHESPFVLEILSSKNKLRLNEVESFVEEFETGIIDRIMDLFS